MRLTKWPFMFSISVILLVGCSSSGGGGGGGDGSVACASTGNDSTQTVMGWNRIRSEDNGSSRYHLANLIRQTAGASGPALEMDYMVHEPPGVATAFMVLIAGGQLTAGIVGVEGMTPSSAGGNFLVRSAHLFAAQGYRVLTIDGPSDAADYGGSLDSYRASMQHAVDLSQLINTENSTNLPVVIAGTSRGTISAVAQHKLGSLIALSAPLTSGGGIPIGSGNVLPENVLEPAHVSWHVLDGCTTTTPANALALVGDLPDATGVSISGGFASAASASPCDADHYHGFPGIESCAVTQATNWVATEIASLPATRPVASDVTDTATLGVPKDIDLTGEATASAMGALTYSLPHTSSSLGGSLAMNGNVVTYTAPAGSAGLVDTFVYVVNETGGGTSHNVVSVTVN